MKYAIVVGSNRENSGSRKTADFLAHHLSMIEDNVVTIIDMHDHDLPIWKESMWSGDQERAEIWKPISEILEESDGYIVIAPEWSGMAGLVVKNFLLYVGKEMAHKPALLVGVSSGRGGAYPISELRSSSYKNTYINYIPEHLIVRDIKNVFTDHEVSETDSDIYIKERSIQTLKLLQSYTKAFTQIREEGAYDLEKYGHGMS